jgi:purine-nucleoside phosphorylase
MAVTDHINLTGTSPLAGPNVDAMGPRFPDMSRVYDRDLIRLAADTAIQRRVPLRQGVYAGVLGPNLETPAETRHLRMIGADAVGMSTVTEAIAGVHCGLKILAIVVITNVNLPDAMDEISIEDVLAASGAAAPRLAGLWEAIIREIED